MKRAVILFTTCLIIAKANMAMESHFFTQVGAGQNRIINVSETFLDEMKRNLTKKVQQIQRDNAIVATSVLQSALLAILDFKRASETHFRKGDDNTILWNLQKCIGEFKQANAEQSTLCAHPMAWLVTEEEEEITILREAFEHCIKIIEEFAPCIGGRGGSYSFLEQFIQKYGWEGWRLQAKQIAVSNRCLGEFLHAMGEKINTSSRAELLAFHDSVRIIIGCYYTEKHPDILDICGVYEQHELKFDYIFNEVTKDGLDKYLEEKSKLNVHVVAST